MATALYRLGRTVYRRWPAFILAWLLLLAGVGTFAATQSKPLDQSFSIDGVPAIEASNLQKELFPQAVSADKQVTGQVVVAAPEGHTLLEEPYKTQVATLVARLQRTRQLVSGTKIADPVVAGPVLERQMKGAASAHHTPAATAEANARALSPLSADRRTGIISWNFDAANPRDVQPETQDAVRAIVSNAQATGLTVAAGGTGMQDTEIGGASEAIGVGIALIILIITFGSFVAAGLPILNAVVGVVLGSLGVTAATAFTDVNSSTPTLSSMIGLAVGIDYSLFILSRYRSELRRTRDREHAIGVALGTAGSAVVFAGLTVVIALTALLFSGISLLGSMGVAAAATVVLAVLVALTLLPALLGMLKGKAFAGRIIREQGVDEDDHEAVNASVRLGRGIRTAPVVVALVAALGLAGLAIPVKDLHLGLPSDATAAEGSEARTSADLIGQGWGAGKNAPMIAVVDARDVAAQQRQAALGTVVQWASSDAGVANAQVVQATKDAGGAVVLITPRTGPADSATDDLLERLRDSQPATESASGAHIGITGQTAIQADISHEISDAFPLYLGIVVVLAFVILVLVFRSLVVPLLATLGFLLSVLATLGVAIKLVQDGTFGIFDPQPVMSLMPTLLVGIVFGLAMDYQVFLTTRMREAYVHGMNPRDAIIDGFRHSGRVVIAAALIMMSVFAAFAFQDNPLIKMIGVSLAVAIVLDAFVVRMILVPAVMNLLGATAWWMPRWLDRVLPHVDVEGAGLERAAGARGASAVGVAPVAPTTPITVGSPAAATGAPSGLATPAATTSERSVGSAPVATPSPAGPGVHGVVTRGGRAPIPGARITLADRAGAQVGRATSGADGRYGIDVAHGGTYLLIVSADDLAPSATLVPVADGPVSHDVSLAGGCSVTGRVVRGRDVDGTTGSPLPGSLVTFTDVQGEVAGHTRTGGDGTFEVDGLTAGPYVLTVQAGRHRPQAQTVDVHRPATNVGDVVLDAGGRFHGTVTSATGRSVPDATLTLLDDTGQVCATTTSDDGGRFAFGDVDSGAYTVIAAGYAPVSRQISVEEGLVSSQRIVLGATSEPQSTSA